MDFRVYEKIKNQINRYEYISFDLFDTLIKRDCFQPIELFHILEDKINQYYQFKSNFADKRVRAEKRARQISSYEEITLDEIYEQLNNDFSTSQIGIIKKWEKNLEKNFCQINPLMEAVYNYCIAQHKIILIVTDIYLSRSLIEQILHKLNIKYNFLFISSEERKTKNSGGLFFKIFEKLGCQPQDILHIGDNHRSDYLIPKKMGINVVQIPKDDKINLFINKKEYKRNRRYADLCAFINNHSSHHKWNAINKKEVLDYFFQIGYEVQGPLLYGFIQWLEHQFAQQQIQKVFFLARDGQLMQKAYNIMGGVVENQYMFASRRALIVPSLWLKPDLKDVIQTITFFQTERISAILKRIGLQPNLYKTFFEGNGFDWEKEYSTNALFKSVEFQTVYDEYIKMDMIENSKRQYQLLVRYLKQINFKGNVAIVDIGWFGNMQRALNKIIKQAQISVKIHGFYIGLNPFTKVLENSVAKGFLFDQNYNVNFFRKERTFNSIFEILFTADHGTTLGYQNKNEKIYPILDCWEYRDGELHNDYKKIEAVQIGALEFIKDSITSNHYIFYINSQIAFVNWICLGFYPKRKWARIFGVLHMLDDELLYIAKPQYEHYGIHMLRLIKDLKKSLWRIGFLTILYGNILPYGNIYYFIRDIIKGKKTF